MKKFAEIILTLKDQASAGISKLGAAFMGLTKIIASVSAGLMASFIEFGKQEEAVRKLDTALKNSGMATEGSTSRLVELANQLQKTTKFADDTSISAMALLGTFGLNEQSITKLLPKIQDMATALDTDLQTAAMVAGKAISSGQIGMLTRYGVVLDETRFKIDPVVAVTEALTDKFNGQAEAVQQGPLGALAKLKNIYNDLMETVGSVVAGPMTDFMNQLSEMMIKLMESKETIRALTDIFFFLGETIMGVLTFAGEMIGEFVFELTQYFEVIKQILTGDFTGAMDTYKNMMALSMESIKTSWDDLVNKIKGSYAKINTERVEDAKKTTANIKDQQKETKENFAWQEEEKKKATEKNKKDWDDSIKEQNERAKKEKEMRDAANKQKIADYQSTLGTISTLMDSNERSLFAVGKAAAIANAIVNTAQGVSKAWALGPIVGPALAAMVAAAGAVQIHKIGATAMAQGGLVMPTRTGTLARIGEAGKAEAVIPLDDDRTKEKLSEVMGGTTIVINAGTLVADDESIRILAEKIDEKLYRLKYNNQTVSI